MYNNKDESIDSKQASDTSGFKLMSFGDWLKEQEANRPNTNTKSVKNDHSYIIANAAYWYNYRCRRKLDKSKCF